MSRALDVSYAIGIDLGGSNVKTLAVDEKGKVLEKVSYSTHDDGKTRRWSESVYAALADLEKKMGAAAAFTGLAAPGLASPDRRSIGHMPPGRLNGLQGLDWTTFLKRDHLVPVLNDAHASLLGEVWIGAAAGCKNAILLTLGTGVGGAILCEGRLLHGPLGRAGHLGHVCLHVEGEPDITGMPGSLEWAMGNATVAKRSNGKFHSARELVEAHRDGNKEATRLWLKSVRYLACGIASFVNILDCEVVILGGGIAQAGEALFDPLQKELDAIEWRPDGHQVRLVQAALGDFAGAIGAARNGMIHSFSGSNKELAPKR